MDAEQHRPTNEAEQPEQDPSTQAGSSPGSSGDQLVDELGRLSRKFVEVLETAWNSDQRRQIEKDLQTGLNSVAESLEDGLKDLSEKDQTKEFIGKAESVADNVGDKVRTSDVANELARGLATGLHVLADQLERLASEMRSTQSAESGQTSTTQKDSQQGQDIPITEESTPETDA